MTTHALEHPRGAHLPAAFTRQVRWLAGGFAIGFLVPFVFAEVLNLPRDLYYAVYITAVLVFFVLWARASGRGHSARHAYADQDPRCGGVRVRFQLAERLRPGPDHYITQNYGTNIKLGLDPAVFGFPGTGCNPTLAD